MSAQQRDLILEYLHAGFTAAGHFSRIEVGRTPLEGYNSQESRRFLSLWKAQERYLVVVHADTQYRPGQDSFSRLLRDMAAQNVACVSVFDDSVFFKLDANEEGKPKAARDGGRKRRIKLLGLEMIVQEKGLVAYYKHTKPKLEVIEYTAGVVADYTRSPREIPQFVPRRRELLTVMEPTLVATHTDSFDLTAGRRIHGLYLTGFTEVVPTSAELDALRREADEEEDIPLPIDQRTRFFHDEAEGGRDVDEIPELTR